MKTYFRITALLVVALLMNVPAFAARKISLQRARAIALKEAAGHVESSELEHERGTLVYSFDIRNAKGTIDEVLVDAYTGRIVAHEHENKTKEAAEKKQEAKERKH